MAQQAFKPRLIHTKRGAIIALCMTAYVATFSFRNVFLQSQHKPPLLLINLPFLLPAWVVAGVNLGFYAGLIWGSVLLYRLAQGKERVLVSCWVTSFFVGFIKYLSASADVAIDYLKAIAMLVALLAAVDILFRMPTSGHPRPDNEASRIT
jgi:hypothetical protein